MGGRSSNSGKKISRFTGLDVSGLWEMDMSDLSDRTLNGMIAQNSGNIDLLERLMAERQRRDREASTSNIKPSQVTVNSDYYQAVNGRPRGNGTWFFFPDRNRNDFTNAISFSGSYSEARKRAQEEAARRGWRNLYVGT